MLYEKIHLYVQTYVQIHLYTQYNTCSTWFLDATQKIDFFIILSQLGLWELCSKFLSLFYFEFFIKCLHYEQFYSFYAYDFIIILHLQVNYVNQAYTGHSRVTTVEKCLVVVA